MDRQKALSYSAACFKGQPASCMCSCPFNVDIRGFADKMKNGRYSSAYRQLRNDLVFPETVSELCDAPCEGSCVRQFLDESVKIRSLEAACFDLTKKKDPQPYRLPARSERIAVIGGGISGLICAYRLAIRKYSVSVYESSPSWGGSLKEHPSWEAMKEEISTQMSLEKTEFILGGRAGIEVAKDYDAVYVATGAGGDDFGLLEGWDPVNLATKREGTFLGGKLTGCNDLTACLHGIKAAQQIEAYILSGKMPAGTGPEKDGFCGHYINTQGKPVMDAVIPSGDIYTSEEAAKEASRCLQCDCAECMDACEMLQKYRKDPIRITTEIYQDAVAVAGASMRTIGREVSSCNLCGLCGKICPENVDTGEAMLYSRRDRVEMGILPPAFHDHWIREMTFALGEASLVIAPDASGKCDYVFFPGCQLGASDPRYVEMAYRSLLDDAGLSCGLILECCGIPARWAGLKEAEEAVAGRLRELLSSMGDPSVICACTSCERNLRQKLPGIKIISLYGILKDMSPCRPSLVTEAAVFDPCASSEEPSAREGVRDIASRSGVSLRELSFSGERARCCGFGGHIRAANPSLFEEIADNRAFEDELPYITYCANCRETFAGRGKQAMHILDVFYGLDDGRRGAVTISGRKRNMLDLKKYMTEKYMGETYEIKREPWEDIKLEIPSDLAEKMEKTLISEDTVRRAVYTAENGGARFEKGGVYICRAMEGVVTVWVHYEKDGDGYILRSVYSHRMEIKGGNNG